MTVKTGQAYSSKNYLNSTR